MIHTAFNNRSAFHAKEVIGKDMVSQMPHEKEDYQLKSISLHMSLLTKQGASLVSLLGGNMESKKRVWSAITGLEMISGQKVSLHYAKKNVQELRLSKGSLVGISCQLRRRNMYQFLENFRNFILPSINGLEGIPVKSMDQHGNCSFTLPNIISFPEIEEEYLHFQNTSSNSQFTSYGNNKNFPLNITFHTSAKNPSQSLLIFSALQLPLRPNSLSTEFPCFPSFQSGGKEKGRCPSNTNILFDTKEVIHIKISACSSMG